MSTTWLVIANETDAKVFKINKKECDLITSFNHPESRLPDHDLISDGPGHYNTPGTSHGAYSPDTPHHEVELINFAQQIGKFLDHEHRSEKFEKLIVCAEPGFYGLLAKEFPAHVTNLIKHHILKDFIPLEKSGKFEHAIKEIQDEFIFS